MKDLSGIAILRRLFVALCAFVLFLAAIAQAEQRPTMTSHVPEAVSGGVRCV